jgi:hypothetical protein
VGILLVEVIGKHEEVSYFVIMVGESQEVIKHLRLKFVSAALQSHRLKVVHVLPHIYHAVIYAIQFPAFTDTSNGLLTFIYYTVEGVVTKIS